MFALFCFREVKEYDVGNLRLARLKLGSSYAARFSSMKLTHLQLAQQLISAPFSSTSTLLAQLKLNNPEVAESVLRQLETVLREGRVSRDMCHAHGQHVPEIKEHDVRDLRLARLKFRSSSTLALLAQLKLNNPEVAETYPTCGRVSYECMAAPPRHVHGHLPYACAQQVQPTQAKHVASHFPLCSDDHNRGGDNPPDLQMQALTSTLQRLLERALEPLQSRLDKIDGGGSQSVQNDNNEEIEIEQSQRVNRRA
ncbi:hypothetical protein GQ457_18G009630 [Hibiscus cannabinus]